MNGIFADSFSQYLWKAEIRNQEVLVCSALHCLVDWWGENSRGKHEDKTVFTEIVSALILDCQSCGSVAGICSRILRPGTPYTP